MLERASFTDAFNYNRRLGIGLSSPIKKTDRYTLSAGLFSDADQQRQFHPHRLGGVGPRHLFADARIGLASTSVPTSITASTTQEALGPAISLASADPDHRPALRRHRQHRRQAATTVVGRRTRRRVQERSTSPPKRRRCGSATPIRPADALNDADAAMTRSPPARSAQRQSRLLGRLCRGRLLLHRRNPRLQGRQVGPHQGA